MNDTLKLKDLWLDANQGKTEHGYAFGYVGTDEETTDENGEDCGFCGWFFTWPGNRAEATDTEIEQVIDSLETDETRRHLPEIDYYLVEKKLRAMLKKIRP